MFWRALWVIVSGCFLYSAVSAAINLGNGDVKRGFAGGALILALLIPFLFKTFFEACEDAWNHYKRR